MSVKRKETGKSLSTSCLNSTNGNQGCAVDDDDNTFGDVYNSNGGGIMAMELRAAGIRIWNFLRASIPADITSGNPDPSTWPEATADYPSTDCDIGSHFKNQSIVANIDLCGSLAGDANVYADSGCEFFPSHNQTVLNRLGPGTCTDYVANNNTAFANAYWEFGAFQIYQAS